MTNGTNMDVYRAEEGGLETLLVSTSAVDTISTTSEIRFGVSDGAQYNFDDIRILAAWMWPTTTYAYNAANELTSMTDYNGTTTFNYDDFGRTTSKTDGARTASYDWRYGSKLESYSSNFFDEGAVTYLYGGDGKRRERTTPGGDYTWYNWDVGWNVINEEDQGAGIGNGTLNMTYAVTPGGPQGVGQILAAVPGTNPATGAYNYMTHDNIRSTRGVFDQAKALAGEFAFTPYGGAYTSHGDSAFRLFTGKPYDTASAMYFFPYRYYNDHTARWISRDPLGMVDGPNVYAYVKQSPPNETDPLGLKLTIAYCNRFINSCKQDAMEAFENRVWHFALEFGFLTAMILVACFVLTKTPKAVKKCMRIAGLGELVEFGRALAQLLEYQAQFTRELLECESWYARCLDAVAKNRNNLPPPPSGAFDGC